MSESNGKTELETDMAEVVANRPVTMPAAATLPSPIPDHIQEQIDLAIEGSKRCKASLLEAVDGLETYVRDIRKRVQGNIEAMDLHVDDSASALGKALTKVQQFGDSMAATWDIIWPDAQKHPGEQEKDLT